MTTRVLDSRFISPENDFEAQYRAASEGAALFDRSDRARIEVTGKDRESFLQNMLSASVDTIPKGHGVEATFLTVKGKLVASLTVFKDDDRLILETEATRRDPLIAALSRYIISEDVTLEASGSFEASLGVDGPGASALLAKLLDEDVSRIASLGRLETCDSGSFRVIATGDEAQPSFDIQGGFDEVAALIDPASRHGAVISSDALAETRRIEAGRARFGVDYDDSHIPLEASLDEAIHFDKGCYIGQEYVVRLAHRGQLQKKLVGLLVEGNEPPPPGAIVTMEGREVGAITSARFSPGRDAVVAFGFLRREAFAPETSVSVTLDDGTSRRAVVTDHGSPMSARQAFQ